MPTLWTGHSPSRAVWRWASCWIFCSRWVLHQRSRWNARRRWKGKVGITLVLKHRLHPRAGSRWHHIEAGNNATANLSPGVSIPQPPGEKPQATTHQQAKGNVLHGPPIKQPHAGVAWTQDSFLNAHALATLLWLRNKPRQSFILKVFSSQSMFEAFMTYDLGPSDCVLHDFPSVKKTCQRVLQRRSQSANHVSEAKQLQLSWLRNCLLPYILGKLV